jgi:hypothetical protein
MVSHAKKPGAEGPGAANFDFNHDRSVISSFNYTGSIAFDLSSQDRVNQDAGSNSLVSSM